MNKNDRTSYLGFWLRRFICEHMVSVLNLSRNTQVSYRDTFRLLLPFIAEKCKKKVDNLLILDLSSDYVYDFLNDLEKVRNCSISTRNQRLAAIHVFAKFVGQHNPEHVEWSHSIGIIPTKLASPKLVTYLEKEEMDALLDAPNKNTQQGWRDYVILTYMYNTGARADETANLKIKDLHLASRQVDTSIVYIIGKGNKERHCPLWQKTAEALKTLIKGRDENENVFLNRMNQPITRFGIYEMVTKYVKQVAKNPAFHDILKKRVTPHTIRHTTGTHLLISGVDIITIRNWLGHVSVDTTNIYAEISMDMKEQALKVYQSPMTNDKNHWKYDDNLMSFLESL